MKVGSYKTKQKDILFDFFETNINNLFSVKEILDVLEKEGIEVGQTTVYRFLDLLVKENSIIVYSDNFEKKYGRFSCCGEYRYHIICTKCGKIEHVNNNVLINLKNNLIDFHDFYLDTQEYFIKGRCKRCK